ncbi:Phosphatidyl-N-methylethanolamine N-methyltransferase [Sesamum angolense]|uniref:phosphatidyl-N-methylethanolamine N-methyltransferase n=1 Tax=Sesamum angolense TaxID=2727404 RepID=A0AAE2C6C2_9LAMI|nr:Phosphatidyl-N-methylethanolamine N-methyltransferase [Sesamum angolense]
MGIWACLGVISPFPYYYFLWNNPQSWVDLCGRGRDPCRVMALVSHFLKLVQFIALFSVSTLSWPPPLYFWPLFLFGQFLNFRSGALLLLLYLCGCLWEYGIYLPFPLQLMDGHDLKMLFLCLWDHWNDPVFVERVRLKSMSAMEKLFTNLRKGAQLLLGESGTYYGVRFGKNIPWVTEFPFGVISDPQYVGSITSLLACLHWVPLLYIIFWVLGYVFMMKVESKEDPSTRAKPLS